MNILIWILSFTLLLLVNSILPWPTIPQEAFDVVANIFKEIWYYNNFIPIDTLFTYATYILLIEFCIYSFKLYDKVRSALTKSDQISDDL